MWERVISTSLLHSQSRYCVSSRAHRLSGPSFLLVRSFTRKTEGAAEFIQRLLKLVGLRPEDEASKDVGYPHLKVGVRSVCRYPLRDPLDTALTQNGELGHRHAGRRLQQKTVGKVGGPLKALKFSTVGDVM